MKHKLFKPSIGGAAVHKAKVKFIDMSNSQQISSVRINAHALIDANDLP